MSPLVMKIFIVAICLVFLVFIVFLVRKKRLLLKYSLLWLALVLVAAFCAIFPGPVYSLAQLLGFEVASNFIFVIGFVFLLAFCLSLSVIASRQTEYIKTLTQELAILKQSVKGSAEENTQGK